MSLIAALLGAVALMASVDAAPAERAPLPPTHLVLPGDACFAEAWSALYRGGSLRACPDSGPPPDPQFVPLRPRDRD